MELSQDLIKGTVVPIILKLVSERRMYGYEIIRVVNERTDNAFQWKEGTLYPCLHRLENEGVIVSEWRTADSGRERKYYSITRKGMALLSERVDEWRVFSKAVNAILMGPATA